MTDDASICPDALFSFRNIGRINLSIATSHGAEFTAPVAGVMI
jgi:hypothetical protein